MIMELVLMLLVLLYECNATRKIIIENYTCATVETFRFIVCIEFVEFHAEQFLAFSVCKYIYTLLFF